MLLSLLWTALIMGLVGGPHCLAMCAAPCGVVTGGAGQGGGSQVVAVHGLQSRLWLRTALFHGGRLAGYASLGAASALARLGASDGLERLEALRDDPVLANGYRLYQALGKYNLLAMHPEAAAAGFEKVLELSPNYMDAIQELGFIYFSTERFEAARDLWMRGLILDPDNAELRQRVHLAEDEMRKHGLLPPVSGG